MDQGNYSESELIKLIKFGDAVGKKVAYNYIYNKNERVIKKRIKKITYWNKEETYITELYYETVKKLFLAILNDKYKEGNMAGYLSTTAYQLCMNELRKKERSIIDYYDNAFEYLQAIEINYEPKEILEIILKIIREKLDKDCNTIFKYKKTGYSLKEIAIKLGDSWTDVKVRTKLSSCRKKLRDFLAKSNIPLHE